MRIVLIMTLSFLICLKSFSQNQALIDSLKQVLLTAKADTNHIKLLLQLGNQYQRVIPDTALLYYQKALDISIKINEMKLIGQSSNSIGIVYHYQGSYDKTVEYFMRSLKIYEELGDKKGMSDCYNNIGIVHWNQGRYDKAIEYFLKSLKIREELGDKNGMSTCYNNIGVIHKNQGSYDKAIEYYLKSLKIKEELGDKKGMPGTYNNIGVVYYNQGSYDKAIEYYHKSLKISEELDDKKGISECYNNIGIIHSDQGNYDKAIEYYLKTLKIEKELGDTNGMSISYNNIGNVHWNQGSSSSDLKVRADKFDKAIEYYLKSLKISEELGDKNGMSNTYNNIGNIHKEQCFYDKAIDYYLKSLKIKEELGDKNGIASSYRNIASLNITLADSVAINENQRVKYLEKTVEFGNKAIDLAREIKAIPIENDAAGILMKAYKNLGNHKKAFDFAEVFISTRNSMFNEEKTKALAEMETKYEAEKKQLQIEKMEKQKELDDKTIEAKQAENRKQQVIIFSALAGLLIVLIFSIIVLRMLQQKRRANLLLAQQNEEINQQKEEITAQRDEIEAQRDLVTNQRDLITEQKHELTDSIHYAYRIQSAVIPSDEYISSLLSDYFILYKPRDIVSGDFYWIGKQDDKVIIIAADCTGHGVPGAFMSMLGVAFLNEIVNKEHISSPAGILNELREYIIKALKQKGKEGESKDGMDVAAVSIDTKTNRLEYSGANNPLYIVKSEKDAVHEGLTEIKPNKQPVAIYERMEPFINYEVNLHKGDTIYIFSDGYIDQFGGPNGKKFKSNAFKNLLLENIDKAMKEQKEILDKTFEEWKGELDQIDDVCVIGIKI